MEVKKFVTLFSVTDVDNKTFTVELFSDDAEEAYFKEKAKGKLFSSNDKIIDVSVLGTFRKVELKVIGE